MRYPTRLLIAALLIAGAGCRTEFRATGPENSNPTQGIIAGDLNVQVDKSSKTLTLRNGTEFVVGYMIVEKDIATIALFPPCGSSCPKLVQGQSKQVAFSEIVGYTPAAREARVMWWTYALNGKRRVAFVQRLFDSTEVYDDGSCSPHHRTRSTR